MNDLQKIKQLLKSFSILEAEYNESGHNLENFIQREKQEDIPHLDIIKPAVEVLRNTANVCTSINYIAMKELQIFFPMVEEGYTAKSLYECPYFSDTAESFYWCLGYAVATKERKRKNEYEISG